MSQLRFPKERPEQSLGFMFWQTTNLWQRKIADALKQIDLTHVQFVLLAGVGWLSKEQQTVTQVQLSNHAKTDIMMTSKVVRTLVTKELVIRKPHPTDTRANVLALSAMGNKKLQEALEVVDAVDQQFFQGIGEQYQSFSNSLKQLSESNR